MWTLCAPECPICNNWLGRWRQSLMGQDPETSDTCPHYWGYLCEDDREEERLMYQVWKARGYVTYLRTPPPARTFRPGE